MLETRAVYPVALEYRAAGRVLSGAFNYGSTATVRDRGRVRKERVAPRAFRFAVEDPERRIELLRGHDFDKPLALRPGGTLELEDADDALRFRAELPPEAAQPGYMVDTLRMLDAGLVRGISPGFRVPPASTVPRAEVLIPEPGNPDVSIREIREAVLFELSLVTRPTYTDTTVELRGPAKLAGPGSADRRFRLWL